MEISNVVRHPYFFLLPIGFVIVCVVLVFAFGFKSSVEPNFRQLSDRYLPEDKKGKKGKKVKEKKIPVAAAGSLENLFSKQEHENHHPTNSKKVEGRMDRRYGSDLPEKPKIKKISKDDEKPVDFDDGEWETAFSRKDKKNRKKDDDKGQFQKTKESSNKGKADKLGLKGKPGEIKDTSDASLCAVSSMEKMDQDDYPATGKKKKKLRKD